MNICLQKKIRNKGHLNTDSAVNLQNGFHCLTHPFISQKLQLYWAILHCRKGDCM